MVLDLVVQVVDHVVGLDDLLGHVQVAVEERLGAGGDRLGRERAEPDQVAADLVELVLERLAALPSRRRTPGLRSSSPSCPPARRGGARPVGRRWPSVCLAVHLDRRPGCRPGRPDRRPVHGMDIAVFTSMSPRGQCAVKPASLPCRSMNEIERTIDVTTDRSTPNESLTRAVGSRARPRLRPRGRGLRLGLRSTARAGAAMERRRRRSRRRRSRRRRSLGPAPRSPRRTTRR